jgi:hypothetical protein
LSTRRGIIRDAEDLYVRADRGRGREKSCTNREHRKFEANHVSDALFEIITVVFPKELILSANFGRSGFGTPVWRATFKENVNVVNLKGICQCASARRLGCSRQLQMGWRHGSVTLTLSCAFWRPHVSNVCLSSLLQQPLLVLQHCSTIPARAESSSVGSQLYVKKYLRAA